MVTIKEIIKNWYTTGGDITITHEPLINATIEDIIAASEIIENHGYIIKFDSPNYHELWNCIYLDDDYGENTFNQNWILLINVCVGRRLSSYCTSGGPFAIYPYSDDYVNILFEYIMNSGVSLTTILPILKVIEYDMKYYKKSSNFLEGYCERAPVKSARNI